MFRQILGAAFLAAAVIVPLSASAHGVPGGVERGDREGERAAGPVGAIVGGTIGGVVGGAFRGSKFLQVGGTINGESPSSFEREP